MTRRIIAIISWTLILTGAIGLSMSMEFGAWWQLVDYDLRYGLLCVVGALGLHFS